MNHINYKTIFTEEPNYKNIFTREPFFSYKHKEKIFKTFNKVFQYHFNRIKNDENSHIIDNLQQSIIDKKVNRLINTLEIIINTNIANITKKEPLNILTYYIILHDELINSNCNFKKATYLYMIEKLPHRIVNIKL